MTRRAKQRRAERQFAKSNPQIETKQEENGGENEKSEENPLPSPVQEDSALLIESRKQWQNLMKELQQAEVTEVDNLSLKGSDVLVSAASFFELPLHFASADGVLTVRFQTKFYDIGFSIIKQDSEGKEEYLIEPSRYNSNDEPVVETHVIHGPVHLYLVWDNEYSWMTEKHLKYSIELKTIEAEQPTLPVERRTARIFDAIHDREAAIEAGGSTLQNLSNVVDSLNFSISDIEHKLEMLQIDLAKQQTHLKKAMNEKQSLNGQIQIWKQEVGALKWKTIDLTRIFAFGSPADHLEWKFVNSDWRDAFSKFPVASEAAANNSKNSQPEQLSTPQ